MNSTPGSPAGAAGFEPGGGGPPKVGSAAPQLALPAFRGTPPATLADGTPRLLFFGASWCRFCKAALPEALAYEAATGSQVIAITDEPANHLTTFFRPRTAPFPQTVAIDELRRAFLACGVSGTPTFVLVDGQDIVQSYATGYGPQKGLGIDGWTWHGRPAQKP